MKTLLFIVLKVLEVGMYCLWIYLFSLFMEWSGIDDWLDKLYELNTDVFVGVLIGISILCILLIIISKFFQSWFRANKKLVNSIFDKINVTFKNHKKNLS